MTRSGKQYPLLGVQHGFVMASGIEATTNTVPAAYRIVGDFSGIQIAEAFETVVLRHDALRTAVARHGSAFIQRVTDVAQIVGQIEVLNWTGQADAVDALTSEKLAEYLALPFDLREAQPWRCFLARVDADSSARSQQTGKSWVLGITVAHVVIDGSSIGIIAADLAAALGGVPQPPAPQLYTLVRKEDERVPSPAEVRYWLEQYEARKAIPSQWTGGPATFHVVGLPTFEQELVAGLEGLTVKHGVSISSMLGALAAAAAEKTLGHEALMLGFATAQRDSSNQNMVGPCHDHLPALGRVPSGASFLEVAGGLHARRGAGRLHRLSTRRLERIAQIAAGDWSTTPFDLALNYGRFGTPQPIEVRGGGTVTAVPVEAIGPVNLLRATTAAPSLTVIGHRTSDRAIAGVAVGISGLFEAAAIAELATAIHAIARRVVAEPERQLAQLM